MILPGNLIYIGTSLPGTKLYANSVLAVYVPTRPVSFIHLTVDDADITYPCATTHGRTA